MSVQHFRGVRMVVFAALCITTALLQVFTPLTSFSAEPSVPQIGKIKAPQLPTTIANKWRSTGIIRVLKGKECEKLPDGEIGLEYGLIATVISNYTDGKDNYVVERFEMRYPSGAYGFLTFLQSKGTGRQRQIWSGRELIRVRHDLGNSFVSTDFFESLAKVFENKNVAMPPLSTHLPKTNKLPVEELYIVGPKALANHRHFGFLKEFVNFEGGTEAVAAEYQTSETPFSLLLLEFHTPQLATDGYAKLDSIKNSLPEPISLQTVIKRIGNYVALATPVNDKKAADAVLGEIKYTAVVHWEGKTYRAIPLEYRPPDTAALEEASETALILLRTFYWIGLMLALAGIFGVGAGSGFFYWRRYQRRKAGIDDLFSDASGSIRLNLEDETEKVERKQLN